MGPDYGYGPVNYTNPEGVSPFAAFDNRISYNEMVRQQMVSQYRQDVVKPANMTMADQALIARDQRFSYGVDQRQDPRLYQRQAESSRMAFGASLSRGMLDVASYGVAESALGAFGIGTTFKALGMAGIGGMAITAGLAGVPMHFVGKGINNALEKRQFRGQIAADIDQYRDKLGFTGGLSYDQSSQLGASLQGRMYESGSFFNKDQQMKIHKIGLANDLLSAKGGGKDSGTMRQYERNVKELTKTTEDVVKLLQTTTEGAMSVMKELNQKGFGSLKQIKQQVIQAKALGNVTGMGSQNMMHVGAAGAQAVQGTPWQASVGAGMYQAGAAQAHMMAQGSPEGAYAVQRAGGVAQAGASLANATMNMMSSGIGTRLAAYAMNGDGSINDKRLNKLLGGDVSAYDIVTQSSQTGYNMGGSRVRFGMFKEDMLNKIGKDPTKLMQMMRTGFGSWSGQRPYDKIEDKAWVYSGMYTQNSRDQRLMYQSLLGNPGFADISASKYVESALSGYKKPGKRYGKVGKALKNFGEGFNNVFNSIGEEIVRDSAQMVDSVAGGFKLIGRGVRSAWEGTVRGIGFNTDSYDLERANYSDRRKTLEGMFSIGESASEGDLAALKGMSREKLEKFTIRGGSIKGFDFKKFIKRNSSDDVNIVTDRLTRAIREGGKVSEDNRLLDALSPEVRKQIEGGDKSTQIALLNEISKGVSQSAITLEERMIDLRKMRKGLSKGDQDALQKRWDSKRLDIHAGQYVKNSKTDDYWNEELKRAIDYKDKEAELKAREGLAANAYNIKYKSDNVKSLIPPSLNIFTDVKSAEKQAEESARDAISNKVSVKDIARYGRAAVSLSLDKDNRNTNKAKRLAEALGVDMESDGWGGEIISKAREKYKIAMDTDPKNREESDKASKLVKKYGIDKLIQEEGFKQAEEDAKVAKGVRAMGHQRGKIRAGILYASERGGVSKEFQDKAMNLFDDVTNWKEFRTDNFDALKTISGILPEQLKGDDYDTKEEFMGYLNNKVSLDKTKSIDEEIGLINSQIKQVLLAKTNDSKQVVIHDSQDKEIKIGGKDGMEKGDAIKYFETERAEKEALKQKLRSESHDENSRGGSMSASVAPPVLNYFNNRWSL